jgi:hypothetical protein
MIDGMNDGKIRAMPNKVQVAMEEKGGCCFVFFTNADVSQSARRWKQAQTRERG